MNIESTELQNTTETAIGFIPCYRLPFFRQKDIEIWNESNLETMANMPDCFVDLTVTSPPYDNLRDYNGYSFPFEEIAKELFRVTKQGGVVVWVVGDATVKGSETGTSFKQALYFMQCGFLLHDTMIFERNTLPQNNNRYQSSFEYMFVFSKGTPKTFNKIMTDYSEGTKKRRKTKYINYTHRDNNNKSKPKTVGGLKDEGVIKKNIWKFNVGNYQSTKDKIAFKHPAIFPEQLANDHIISWSNENDLVYDPFGGSGTTAKMSHLQKRKCIMSEISLEYCQIAKKRIEPYLMQECLF